MIVNENVITSKNRHVSSLPKHRRGGFVDATDDRSVEQRANASISLRQAALPCRCPQEGALMSRVKVVVGINDLESRFPSVAEEFSSDLNGGVLPSEVYAFTSVRYWFKCKQCGNEWLARVLERTRNNHGCPNCRKKLFGAIAAGVAASRRKPNSQFVFEAARLNPSVSVVGRYINNHTRIDVRCNSCGRVWSQFPGTTLRGSGCNDCYNRRRSMTIDDINGRLEADGRTVRVVGGYTRSYKKALIECGVCGHTWSANVQSVLRGGGCPECAVNTPYTRDTFVAKAAEENPDIEVLGQYNGVKSPISVKCKKCGHEWTANAERFISRTSCPHCGKYVTRSIDWLKERISEVNPNIVPMDNYRNLSTKMTFKCLRCGGTWDTTPTSILSGTGCPKCNVANRSFFEAALLHALRDSLGDELVLSRDRSAIGAELDIYIPSRGLAFEPGSWFYHKHTQSSDLSKLAFCEAAGIELDIIYFGIPAGEVVEHKCTRTDVALSAQKWEDCKHVIEEAMNRHGISHDGIDWDSVRKSALLVSGRKTTEELKGELSKVNPDIEVLGEYAQNHTPIDVKCRICGHEWSAEPNNLLSGKGCPKCRRKNAGLARRKTHEEFARELAEKNKKVTLVGKYMGSTEKVEVKCVRCGRTFLSKPGNLLNGRGCIKCRHKKTHDEFVEDLKKVNPNIIPLGEYKGHMEPLPVKCAVCGHEWSVKPRWLLEGHGCYKCGRASVSKKLSHSHEDFLNALEERGIHIDVIEEYRGANEKIEFRCPVCGEHWHAKPSNILSGRGCPKCGKDRTASSKRLSDEEFRKRMSDLRDDFEVVGKYNGYKEPVEVMCKECGHTWSATPASLRRCKGCPECRKKNKGIS